MGREIVYCHQCGNKIPPTEFEKGKAVWLENRAACSKCAPKTGGTSKRISGVRKAITAPIPVEEPAEPAPPAARLRLLLLGGTGVLGLIVLVGVLYLVLRPAPPPPPSLATAAPPKAVSRPVEAVPATPFEVEARQALEEARKFGLDRPEDLPGRVARLQDVVFRFDRSASGKEARAELDTLKVKLESLVQAALTELEERLKPLEGREEFGEAFQTLKEAKKEIESPTWTLRVDKRVREIEDHVRKQYEALENLVIDARGAGEVAKVKAARERVARWALKEYSAKFQEVAGPATVEAAAPPPTPAATSKPVVPEEAPPRSAEAKEYRARWDQAMRRVAARDFAAASKELASADLREEETRKEAAADAEDLQRMASLWEEALKALSSKPRAAFLDLEVRGTDGTRKKLSGSVVESDAERVELRAGGEKETVFVEYADLAGSSLGPLLKEAKPDPRLLAQLALVDGGIESASALLAPVAAKYWTFAKDPSRAPRAEGERSALALYYAAQREYRKPATRAAAVEKYRTLLNEFAAVPAVIRLLPHLQKRAQSCREYFLSAGDLRGRGTMRSEKHALLEKAWISKADSDVDQTLENHVEFEFVALADVPYRAWVYLGGCCAETFGCYYQASDLTMPNPEKPKETLRAEPETTIAVPLKHGIRNLKATHAAHKKDPKAPARWEWAELPMPKFAAAGLKRVRLNTSQQGFAVGCVVISGSRKLVPTEAELKEFLKARAAEPSAVVQDPGLVACWTFDDGPADGTGNGHDAAPEKGPAWVPGAVGGALAFDGVDDSASVADHESLRLAGDLTIAFWMKKTGEPAEWGRIIGKGDSKVRNYGVWEEPGPGRKLLFQQYDANGANVLTLNSAKEVAVGAWTHVAAVISGTRASIYVDGALDVTATRTGAPGTSNQPLTFGSGIHGFYQGLLDEVRIYNRALGADEIRALAGK